MDQRSQILRLRGLSQRRLCAPTARLLTWRLLRRALKELDASTSWVGDLLPVVEIDDWGKFRFALLRVRDEDGRTKLILRGRNYAEGESLKQQLRQQVRAHLGKRLREAGVDACTSGHHWGRGCAAEAWPRASMRRAAAAASTVSSDGPTADCRLQPAPSDSAAGLQVLTC